MNDGKVNILIVDDKPEKLLALEAVLEDLGQNDRPRLLRARGAALPAQRRVRRHPARRQHARHGRLRDRRADPPAQEHRAHPDHLRHRVRRRDARQPAGTRSARSITSRRRSCPRCCETKVAVFVDLYRKTEQVSGRPSGCAGGRRSCRSSPAASLAINSALSIEQDAPGGDRHRPRRDRQPPGDHALHHRPATGQRAARRSRSRRSPTSTPTGATSRSSSTPIADTVVVRSHTATRMTEAELREHPDWEIVRAVRHPARSAAACSPRR